MPIFIIQGRYAHEAMQGMVAKPEDRAGPVAKLMESVGGRLLSYYMTFGASDFHVTVEAPDERAMLSVLAAVGAGPGVSELSPAGDGQIDIGRCELDRPDRAAGALAGQDGGSRAAEGLEDDVAFVGVGPHQELRQHHREHGRVLGLDAAALVVGEAQHVVRDPEVLHR
jgi:uncharacterized protein with GYD domain